MNEATANLAANTGLASPDNPRVGILRDGLAKTIERVANVIDQETESLRLYQLVDLVTFNHQKSHGLLELTRAIRALPPTSFDHEILQDLARLREKLEKNLAVLDIHLKAVRQVSALIARAIEDDNSDGTYSASINQPMRQL
jgi:hypothetical protein